MIKNHRLTSAELTLPLMVLQQLNLEGITVTHRDLPFDEMLKRVRLNTFVPDSLVNDSNEPIGINEIYTFESGEAFNICSLFETNWCNNIENIINMAESIHKIGVSGEFCKHLISPYIMHTVILTATNWENFRSSKTTGPLGGYVAYILDIFNIQMESSKPENLKHGEWHIPYKSSFNVNAMLAICNIDPPKHDGPLILNDTAKNLINHMYIKLASAKIAYDYNDELEAGDFESLLSGIYDRSSMKHCAVAMNGIEYNNSCVTAYNVGQGFGRQDGWCGNYRGFIDCEKFIPAESPQVDA